jgi:hypothetical protein
MKIEAKKIDLSKYGIASSCSVYQLFIEIKDINRRASEMLRKIADQNWMLSLDVCDRASYNARAKRTIKKLTSDIINQVGTLVTEEFGEYLVSTSAQDALEKELKHTLIPLAELWKEKMSGNPGFDLHTVCPNSILCFGEAKYSSMSNPHMVAVKQIISFIEEEKDVMELADLRKFATEAAITNAISNIKGYIAAFSITGKRIDLIFSTVLKSPEITELLKYKELYLVGIKLC